MTIRGRLPAPPPTHPVTVTAGQTLTPEEARYVEAARAANTVRGSRTDWRLHLVRERRPRAAAGGPRHPGRATSPT